MEKAVSNLAATGITDDIERRFGSDNQCAKTKRKNDAHFLFALSR
jgi:hypothetical protein